ncbi:aldehyde dehydrogenase (NAD+) [Melghiribacillus thermohalophilus]|uniref:Aldehyde dehydrogenase (NAD+) n=1 Tax=Melghiribacillus thermohalophilus TaxID=1324956 RepID=A0A4R3NCJ7_9BACI|nr:aldehyde dehydrogenase family protein [Melghiribacillus thermohalophilus]TCT26491.1 aldehyde dehydrogenase (NAD+) [Melghiribacillus thermohalophilus]
MTQTYYNYIGGTWVPSVSGDTYPSINPANTEEVLGYFQKSTSADVQMAIKAASKAFPGWSSTSAPKRGEVLFRLISLLEEQKDELAAIITKEVGKSLREAKGEVKKTIQAMQQFSGEATRLTGETVPSYDTNVLGYTVREPLGVVGVIAPYNFPLGIGIWKIAPAILAGNTVIFKPASHTSLISVKIMELFEQTGVPSGVINMVTGPGSVVGKEIGQNPEIQAVSFTGSTDVGVQLGKWVTNRGGRMQAEMGGKNPTIILEDADIDQALDSVVISGFLDNGQRCTGTSRLIVPKSIAKEVTKKLVERAEKLVIGDGFEPGVDNGPVIDESQLNKYLHYVQEAIEQGARLEYGGKRLMNNGMDKGYFVAPTVFSQVRPEMSIAQEEIFGPVIGIMEVDSYEEAIEIANNIDFGLSSAIFTRDLKKAFHFVRNIESGVTHVNMPSTHFENQYPFGGKKSSSMGPREQGSSALEFWTETKTVYVNP